MGSNRRLTTTWSALARAGVLGACSLGFSGTNTSCAADTILDAGDCGNGVVDGDDACDNDSDGCISCRVATGWACPDNVCHEVCGDGVVTGDEECDTPDRTTCDSACKLGKRTSACDMTGYWITRQTDFSIDRVLNSLQTSSNWYVYKLSQAGDTFSIDEALFCGIRVSGTVDVVLPEAGVRGLIYRNPQDATNTTQGPRQGTSKLVGSQCEVSLERWYFLRGLDFDAQPSFAPPDFSTGTPLRDLRPMPTKEAPDGQLDTDLDGHPGVAWNVSGNASGIRHTVMRDWNEYAPHTDFPAAPNEIEFDVFTRFDNEERILEIEGCPPVGCGVLSALSDPSQTAKGRTAFRYLGSDLSDPRVSAVIGAPLLEDLTTDLQTCARVRSALVHKDSKDLGVTK